MENQIHSKGLEELQRKSKKTRRKRLIILFTLFTCVLISPCITLIRAIQFEQNCEGYLKQAADASSPEIALERINVAISYMESHNLTSGYTSIVYKTENDNVGFWYKNIVKAREELQACIGASQLEKTNVLMKVREVLTDNDDKGTIITIPSGISLHPHNRLFAVLNLVSFLFLFIFFSVTKS